MERVKENIKLCDYIIQNAIKLLKKNKIKKINLSFENNIINIEVDDDIYIINSVISYKKFIDNISLEHKVILKYIPKIENNNIIESIDNIYKKYHKVNITLEENYCLN